MAKVYSLIRDVGGYNGFGLQFPDYKKSVKLAQNTAASFNISQEFSKWLIIFGIEPGTNVFVAVNGTVTIPSSASIGDSDCILNPVALAVNGNDLITLKTPDTSSYTTMSLWGMPY